MVDDQSAICREQRGKLMEGVADIINIFEEIHMVFFYVQDNSNLWKEMQKAISVFAGPLPRSAGEVIKLENTSGNFTKGIRLMVTAIKKALF